MQTQLVQRWLLAVLFVPFLFAVQAHAQAKVIITQLYGAGGNSGATYNADYIELFNAGNATASLDNYAIQYGSATGGTITTLTTLPTGYSLKAGQYILIAATAGTNGAALPVTPDIVTSGTGMIAFATAAGKVYLTNSQTKLAATCAADASIVDFIGYGTTASCYLGTGPAPAPSATSSDIRTSVCVNQNDNSKDFTIQNLATGTPVLHNQASALAPCSGGTTPTGPTLSSGTATPATVTAGNNTLLTVTAAAGTAAISTVTADVSAFGGSATQTMYDDGTHGDATAGDKIYSYTLAVPSGQTAQAYTITFKATDAGALTATATASLTVQSAGTPTALALSNVKATPSTVTAGSATVLSATVTAGTLPASTGIAVTVDLSGLGGSATQPLYDDGTHGDTTAGDGVYNYSLTVASGQAAQTYTLNFKATDSQARTATGAASLTVQAPIAASATVALSTSASTATVGTGVQFTGIVTGNKASTPTGTVTFYDGATSIGTGTSTVAGTYTLSTTSLGIGTHTITAVYSGDGTYPPYTTPNGVTVTITAAPVADFTLSLANLALTESPLSKLQTTQVSVVMQNGFSQTVTFTCSGMPAGGRCFFTPATLTQTGTTTLTVAIDDAALVRQRFFSHAREGFFALTLLSLPFAFSKRRRKLASRVLALLVLGMVGMGITGCGTDNSTPAGTSTITVTATGGGVTHKATFTLNVQ